MKAWNDLDHHPAAPAIEVHRRAFVRGPQLGESVLRRPNFEMLQEPSADPLASPIGPDNHALQPRRSIAALVDVEFAKTDSSDARTVCINGDEGDRKAFRSRLAPRDLDPPLPVRGLRRMSPTPSTGGRLSSPPGRDASPASGSRIRARSGLRIDQCSP